jgi:hypothetical protein
MMEGAIAITTTSRCLLSLPRKRFRSMIGDSLTRGVPPLTKKVLKKRPATTTFLKKPFQGAKKAASGGAKRIPDISWSEMMQEDGLDFS